VRETDADLAELQALIERGIESAGPFLRSSFQMPEHTLSARQLVRCLEGLPTVACATVSAKGEPRVAPIGALFYRGRFHIPTTMAAARTRHVRRRPAISVTYYQGIDLAVIVHGRATILGAEHPDFATLEALQRAHGGDGVSDWGEGAFLKVDADALYSFARYPAQFPE
jgi:hypothetical protein